MLRPDPASGSAYSNRNAADTREYLEAGLQLPANPARRDLAAAIDTPAATCLAQPGAPAGEHLRPERVGPALQGTYGIDPTAAVCLQKDTATVRLCRCHQLTIRQAAQVTTPEPASGQTKQGTDGFRLVLVEENIITVSCNTAVSATGAFETYRRFLKERDSCSTHGDRLR
jgi:hypothetical protein